VYVLHSLHGHPHMLCYAEHTRGGGGGVTGREWSPPARGKSLETKQKEKKNRGFLRLFF
jgi:hypothetical protein